MARDDQVRLLTSFSRTPSTARGGDSHLQGIRITQYAMYFRGYGFLIEHFTLRAPHTPDPARLTPQRRQTFAPLPERIQRRIMVISLTLSLPFSVWDIHFRRSHTRSGYLLPGQLGVFPSSVTVREIKRSSPPSKAADATIYTSCGVRASAARCSESML